MLLLADAMIHNVDQKTPVVRLTHPNLRTGGSLAVAQHAAGSAGFRPDTSSVCTTTARASDL